MKGYGGDDPIRNPEEEYFDKLNATVTMKIDVVNMDEGMDLMAVLKQCIGDGVPSEETDGPEDMEMVSTLFRAFRRARLGSVTCARKAK